MPRYPGSGRKKGSGNKDKLPLLEKAIELGVNPWEILLRYAKGDWAGLGCQNRTRTEVTRGGQLYEVENITMEMRLKAATEACQYLYAKRRSIEIKEDKDPNSDRPLKDLSDEELERL